MPPTEALRNWYDRLEMPEDIAHLHELVTAANERAGAVWTLRDSEDLNANLVRFPLGRGVAEHTNAEVDVIFVGVSGSGVVMIDGVEYSLPAGTLVFVPKETRRSTRSASEEFAYLAVHRRRGLMRIGSR